MLRHVNTDSSNDGGGGGSTDARHTNSMKAYNSTDMAGNSHRDSTHSSHPGIQTQFRPKPEHQNAAREQKRNPPATNAIERSLFQFIILSPYDLDGRYGKKLQTFLLARPVRGSHETALRS